MVAKNANAAYGLRRSERSDDMITGLGGCTIWSSDLQNLLPFYRDIVGLPVTLESPRFVLLGPTDQPSLGLGSHSEVNGKATDPYRHMVGFNTDDIRADFERMKGAGAEFIEEPNQQDGLMLATFRDPEGNICQLFQFGGP
jgi:predicted enzyme related to lactoylglutathione lyase